LLRLEVVRVRGVAAVCHRPFHQKPRADKVSLDMLNLGVGLR
jgi:hypothetical protein